MKKFRKYFKEIVITSGVLATVIGVALTYFISNSSDDKSKEDKNSVNFNGDTQVTDSNISAGSMTVYEDLSSSESTDQSPHDNRSNNIEQKKRLTKHEESTAQNKAASLTSIGITHSNIANNITIKSEDIKKLIDYYRYQAEEIRNRLTPLYSFAPLEEFLIEFEELHKSHISALKDQNLILAAKYLQKIHRLSSQLAFREKQLEKDYAKKYKDSLEITLTEVEYQLAYVPGEVYGNLANKYITGEFNPYSRLSIEWPIPEEYEVYLDSTQKIQYTQQILEFYQDISREILGVN